MNQSQQVNSVVIGGGISGMVAAKELVRLGDSVILFEATESLGGLISSVELLGRTVDSGAESFAISRPQTLRLIERLGLAENVVRPTRSDARIRIGKQTVSIPVGILGIPADLADASLLESVGGAAVTAAKVLDAKPWNVTGSPSIGEVVSQRLGQPFLDRLVAPVIGGVHASDPMKLELKIVAPGLLEAAELAGSLVGGVAKLRASAAAPGAAVSGFKGGMHKLVDALASELMANDVEIRLNSAVTNIRIQNDDFQVQLADGSTVTSERLVIAVPTHVAAILLQDEPSIAEPLANIKSVDVAVVALAIQDSALAAQPLGSGVLVAEGDGQVIAKASTHSTAKWSWLKDKFDDQIDVLRFSYGRDGSIGVVEKDLVATALGDAKIIYGLVDPKLLDSAVAIWSKSLIQAVPGHQDRLAKIQAAVAKVPGLALVGAGLGGNGITGIIAKTQDSIQTIGVRNFNGE